MIKEVTAKSTFFQTAFTGAKADDWPRALPARITRKCELDVHPQDRTALEVLLMETIAYD